MSELKKDQEVVKEGRREPLKGVDASLRDQVNRKLFEKLKEMGIGQKVVNLWTRGSHNRQVWLERQSEYLQSWDEHLISDTSGSFAGSSQLHIPMPWQVCKTMHARFYQALWQDPPFTTKAGNEASMERVNFVHDLMRYYVMLAGNYGKGFEAEVDKWLWRWITTGSGIVKSVWDQRYTRFTDIKEVQVAGKPRISIQDGKEVVIPTTRTKEVEFVNTKKTFDGPVIRPCQVEDILIIGGNGDPDEADAVLEQDWVTANLLWTLVDRKIFDKNAVEAVIESGPQKKTGVLNSQLKNLKAENAGKSNEDFEYDHDRYQLIESYLKVDIDGSGIDTDVVVWVHYQTKELLGANYLYRLRPNGCRPYAKIDFILRENQEYGIGLPEILYPLSRELDAMHNMRIDFGLISVMPFGFYRPASGIDPVTIKLEPGALIPVDNPQSDIYFPNLGNRTVFGMQEEQAIMTMVERLTSISDLNMGLISGQGVTRTASGSNALMSEMSSNLDIYLKRLNRGWRKVLKDVLHMVQKRAPVGLGFRVTGEDGSEYMQFVRSREDTQGDFDIEVSPNTSSSNMSIQQNNAQQILQLVNNPLAINMGIVGPGQYYEAVKNYLRAYGIKDYGKYINKPQGYERQLTPEEEANRILLGMEVAVTPNMDHQGFIDFYQQIHDTDELMGQFDVQQIGLLHIQMKKHKQMLDSIQQQKAQQANAAQMRMNVQAGAGANPMSLRGSAPEQGIGGVPVMPGSE